MNTTDSNRILFREIPMVHKIIRDETWLEGERRGCEVSPLDTVVCENVCRIVLKHGHQIRESAARECLKPSPWEGLRPALTKLASFRPLRFMGVGIRRGCLPAAMSLRHSAGHSRNSG